MRLLDKIDVFNRGEFIDKLIKLIESIAENRTTTSFAINGAWGSGKTFVLDMFEERLSQYQLEETKLDKYFIVHYNCWKYDYYEEPLVAIVAAMIDIINEKTKLWNDEKKKAKVLGVLKSVGAALLSMANSNVKDKTGVDLKAAFEVVKKGTKSGKEKYDKSNEYDIYFSFKQALGKLQKLIAELSQDQTILFVVDELDRCLPEYAIKVLERLHHLTEDVKNVITIISIDKNQLNSSINQIFGPNKAEQYLKKFIKFEIVLSKGVVSEKFVEKYSDYISLFDAKLVEYDESIEEFAQIVFNNIDAREQEQLIHKAQIAHTLLFDERKDYSFLCIELLIVVIVSCYKNKWRFCKWLDLIPGTRVLGDASPPFSDFFEEKFNNLPSKWITTVGYGGGQRKLVLEATNSLYSSIAYLWGMVFLDSNNYKANIDIKENKGLLERNIEDLKKYLDTIRFIK